MIASLSDELITLIQGDSVSSEVIARVSEAVGSAHAALVFGQRPSRERIL